MKVKEIIELIGTISDEEKQMHGLNEEIIKEFLDEGKELIVWQIILGCYHTVLKDIPKLTISYEQLEENAQYKGVILHYRNIFSEFEVRDGVKNGISKFYNPYNNGNLYQTMEFKDDKQHGLTTEYNENGSKYLEENFSNGFIDGYRRYFYENGNVKSEEFFIEGFKIGSHKTFYESGKIETITEFQRGLKNGIFIEYFEVENAESRSVKLKGFYMDNKDHGKFIEYNNDGTILSEKTYFDGKEVQLIYI